MTDTDADIERALGYPYERPLHSYLLDGDSLTRLPLWTPENNRLPVLACGSNAAPAQLIRKFINHSNRIIPVTSARLKNFVSVYSPHISGYGAIPATLMPAHGMTTQCHITWLTPDQLTVMHASEAVGSNYRFSELLNTELQCDLTGLHSKIYAYIGKRGVLKIEGQYLALSSIPVDGERPDIRPLSQLEIQDLARQSINHKNNINQFILSNLKHPTRLRHIEALQAFSAPYPPFAENIILDEKVDV